MDVCDDIVNLFWFEATAFDESDPKSEYKIGKVVQSGICYKTSTELDIITMSGDMIFSTKKPIFMVGGDDVFDIRGRSAENAFVDFTFYVRCPSTVVSDVREISICGAVNRTLTFHTLCSYLLTFAVKYRARVYVFAKISASNQYISIDQFCKNPIDFKRFKNMFRGKIYYKLVIDAVAKYIGADVYDPFKPIDAPEDAEN